MMVLNKLVLILVLNEMIAIVGKSTWEVMNARKKLKAQWEPTGEIKETMMGRGGKRSNHSRQIRNHKRPIGING
jgi:hypothetical protein